MLSINDDGTDPVWKDVKPAPEAGKTVIGIVFQTDAKRISATEKAAGHTNGLVMAVRTAHGEKSMFTRYSFDSDFENIPNKKLGTSWYGDIEGYNWTEEIKKAYPGDRSHSVLHSISRQETSSLLLLPERPDGMFLPSDRFGI